MGSPQRYLTQLEDPAPSEVAGFCCVDAEDLRDFLVNDALVKYVRPRLARVYLGWQEGCFVGFFTLSCGLIRYEEVSKRVRTATQLEGLQETHAAPAVLLGRLAVDERFRDQGIGTWLFREAVALARFVIAPHVGCRFLLIDAIYDRIEWYQHRGCFVLNQEQYPPHTTRMAFDLFPPGQ